MEKLDYIFLDFDGPILDGKFKHYNCYKDIIVKDGGIPIDINQYWDMKRNKVSRDVLLRQSNYQGSYQSFLEQWVASIEKKHYLEQDVLKPNIHAALSSWLKLTKKIILVTMRNNRDTLLWQLSHLDLRIFFDEIISCPHSLTQADVKYHAIKHFDFKTAVMIGDTEEDTNTARKLNINSIAITNGLREKKYLDADYYYEEIFDIPLLSLFVEHQFTRRI